MEWNIIESQEDIQKLLNIFGDFHDSCIKELKYVSGAYVSANLAMNPSNSKRDLSVIFQRQCKDPTVIEIVFEGVQKVNLIPSTGSKDWIIYEASLKRINGTYYWADWDNFENSDIDEVNRTWISASKIKWRVADGYVGEDEVYITRDLKENSIV